MDSGRELQLKFWGVRGSIPTPTPENLGFGGNTTCIELRSPRGILIIDGGTGARRLGACLQEEFSRSKLILHLLITHFHWDHIQGLPFFDPLYSPDNEIVIYSSRPAEEVRNVLQGQMASPYFPVGFEFMTAVRSFVTLCDGVQRAAALLVHPFPLNHPQGATGFRIELNGTVITHASDLEHGHPKLDRILRDYAQSSDILIYDAQYTPEEYESKKGWGHSTWLEATRVARECNVKRLILFHHHPGHDDAYLREIVCHARKEFENTDAATEGLEINL